MNTKKKTPRTFSRPIVNPAFEGGNHSHSTLHLDIINMRALIDGMESKGLTIPDRIWARYHFLRAQLSAVTV